MLDCWPRKLCPWKARKILKQPGVERGYGREGNAIEPLFEFRSATRAQVDVTGGVEGDGGGAVAGTGTSHFSWVWFAFRDWPPAPRGSFSSFAIFRLNSGLVRFSFSEIPVRFRANSNGSTITDQSRMERTYVIVSETF